MTKTYITSKQLISELGISPERLTEIEKFFDDIPDDKWELNLGKDYRIVDKLGRREYTQSGAYAVARYVDATDKGSILDQIRDWFTNYKKKIRQSFVRRKITDNCSSLIKRNNIFWISKRDAIYIFGTNHHYFKKVEENAKKYTTLIERTDYDHFNEEIYYSLSGLGKLAEAFSKLLTKKNRQDECLDVKEVIAPHVESIVEQIKKRDTRIKKSCIYAKEKRDKKTCWITGEKPHRNNKFNLASHHLYSRNEYPHLADSVDNIVTIKEDIHKQFHEDFMGGNHRSCTPDDFMRFIHNYYPESASALSRLEEQKRKLGHQEPVDIRKPHVLYLPVSRIS